MNYHPFFEILFIIWSSGLLTTGDAQCTAGQFLFGTNDCRKCPPDSYMDKSEHSFRECFKCTTDKDPNSKLQHSCNSTHDNVFRCADNFFNYNGFPVVCYQCRVCEHVAQNCTPEEDAICCPHEGMTPKEIMGNSTCETKSIDNKRYCCIAKTPSYSTTITSSIQHSTGQESISLVTKATENSSSSLMNSSVELESSKNSSSTDNESMSDGILAVIIIGSSVGGLAVIVLVIILYLRFKRQCERRNRAIGERRENTKNEQELDELR